LRRIFDPLALRAGLALSAFAFDGPGNLMVATKELRGVAHNLAHHSQSSLSWVHPHLARVCKQAGTAIVTFDLLPENPYPPGLPNSEPLRLALSSLRTWFLGQLEHLGHAQSSISHAVLTFRFRDTDDYNSAVAASIGTSTGKAYSGGVDFF
jgi:hypothetical protein